jgi:PKD repeat protein
MRAITAFLATILCCTATHGYISDQNLFVLTGRDVTITEGDRLKRAVFFIEVPDTVTGKIHVRVFDADLAGSYDRWQKGSEVLYRVFGKDNIDWNIRSVEDELAGKTPLALVRLGENKYFDNKWRTIASVDVSEGEPEQGKTIFQLVIDGSGGQAVNKYQIFISSMEKENKPIERLRIHSPVVLLHLPPDTVQATQIRFIIPANIKFLDIYNFDADQTQLNVGIDFETRFKPSVPISPSTNGKASTARVEITPDQWGQPGAIVIRNRKQANYIQLWIFDDQKRTVPLFLPVFMAPENRLPISDFRTIPLSDCYVQVLDASGSKDPDGDELEFEWFFPDGVRKTGSRIVHDFQRPGDYAVVLKVADDSGFVADSSRIQKIIRINAPPVAEISGPQKGVPGKPLTFNGAKSADADGTIISYRWTFGDGAKAMGKTVNYAWPRAGKYKVTLTVADDGNSLCSQAHVSQWIWINSRPVPRLSMPEMGAIDEDIRLEAVGSVDSDGEIASYNWNFGDGATAQGISVSHAWKKPGQYPVELQVTDDAGLANSVATEKRTITINAPPLARPQFKKVVAAGEPVVFDGKQSDDPDGTIEKYVWHTGDGTRLEGLQARHVYKKPGIYQASLTVTDNTDTKNNTSQTTFSIRVNHPPVPDPGPDRIINVSKVEFDASGSTDKDDPIIEYTWNFGDGNSVRGQNVSHVYAIAGKYMVTLTVTDGSGTNSASRSKSAIITVNHRPVADAGADRVAAPGEEVVLDGSFSQDPDGDIVSYEWTIDDKTVSNQPRPVFRFERSGTYQVRLLVTDNNGAKGLDHAVITVNAPPIADFFPIERTAPNIFVDFDASCAFDPDGTLTKIQWDFGDGSPISDKPKTKHAYKSPGRYRCTLTVYDDSKAANNSGVKTGTVEVNFPPQADAGSDIHTCSQNIVFDASASTDPDSDVLAYRWDFGDDTFGLGRQIMHRYADPGIYPVTLSVNDGHGFFNSVSREKIVVRINAPPKAVITTNSKTVCAGELMLFDASKSFDPEKGMLRYLWDLGDGNIIEGVNPTQTYKKGGDYRIRLMVTDDSHLPCDRSGDDIIIHVIDAPIAAAGPDQTVCANTPVQFDGTGSTGAGRRIKTYEWDFGDGQYGVGATPSHVYPREGVYTARLTITVFGESDCVSVSEDEMTVTVMAAPLAKFSLPASACPGEKIDFNSGQSRVSDGRITQHRWDFGDSFTGLGETVSHIYQNTGTYSVTLNIASDTKTECKVAQYETDIHINARPKPVIELTAQGKPPFAGKIFKTAVRTVLHFNGSKSEDSDGFVQSYTWNFGDGTTKTGSFVSHAYEHAGEYSVELVVDDGTGTACAVNTGQMVVKVGELAPDTIDGPAVTCTDTSVAYALAKTSDVALEWIFSDGTRDKGKRISKTFSLPGVYQLQAKKGDDWLSAMNIRVLPLPQLTLPQKIETWPGDKVNVHPVYDRAAASAMIFFWKMGDGMVIQDSSAHHIYKTPGEYTMQLIASGKSTPDCMTTEIEVPVFVLFPPKVVISVWPEAAFSGGARDEIMFEAHVNNSTGPWIFYWDFGDRTKAAGKKVYHTYKKGGNYRVTVTLSDAAMRSKRTWSFSKEIDVGQRKR